MTSPERDAGKYQRLDARAVSASLTRLHQRIVARFPERNIANVALELAGPVARLRSNFINGIKHMPVRFTPERRSAGA